MVESLRPNSRQTHILAMQNNQSAFLAFRGALVDCPQLGEIRCREALIVVDVSNGKILSLSEGSNEENFLAAHGLHPQHVWRLKEHEFLLPGFCDLHIHAPQYPFAGTATDTPLMQWLDKYTFAFEQRFQDLEFAKEMYRLVVGRTLANGTTTAAYYGTLHSEPSMVLADTVEALGQRAVVGKVSMDRNSPDGYSEGTQEGLEACEDFIKYVLSKSLSRLVPAVTPRFVPTCTPAMLMGCGALAAKHGLHIQSHISESWDEVAYVEQLHPEVNGRDLPLFQAAGLLTPKSIMAHGVLLTDSELRRMAETGASIAHCALSNFFFAGKILRVRHVLSLGVKVGLGTDVAGGYSPSILNAIRATVIASKALGIQSMEAAGAGAADLALRQQKEGGGSQELSWREGLWLATAGGAAALGWQDRIGSFEPGKEFDAMLVDTGQTGAFDSLPNESLLSRLEKFVNLGDDRSIRAVWVQGRQVKGA